MDLKFLIYKIELNIYITHGVLYICCYSPNLWVSPNRLFQHSRGRIVNRLVLGPVCLPVNFVIWHRKAAGVWASIYWRTSLNVHGRRHVDRCWWTETGSAANGVLPAENWFKETINFSFTSQWCFFKKIIQDKLLGTTREHALKAVANRPVCQHCITTTAILFNNLHTRFHLYQ